MADAIRSGLTDGTCNLSSAPRSKGMRMELTGTFCVVVGLARPLAAEPFLVAEMLNGTKSRAKEDKLPPGQILRVGCFLCAAINHPDYTLFFPMHCDE